MATRFKSIAGAERRIRQLEKIVAEQHALLRQFDDERKALAKLAAKGPAFFNPLDAFAAETVRDQLLAKMGMNPDGTFRKGGE